MIFTKYTMQLSWHVRVFPSISALPNTDEQKPAGEDRTAILCFLASLLDQLQVQRSKTRYLIILSQSLQLVMSQVS